MWNKIKSIFGRLFGKSKDAKEMPLIYLSPKSPWPKREPGDDVVVTKPVEPPSALIPTLKEITQAIETESEKWVGVREHGYNKGAEVEMFQKFVDGKAAGESWCMCFAQYVAGQVCAKYGIKTPLYPSEHCNTVFNHTDGRYKSQVWGKGFMFIMKAVTSSDGHTGYCDDNEMAWEGNTNAAGHSDGDGVLYRWRSKKGSSAKPMRGFIDVPLMIQDAIVKARAK